MQQMEIPAAQLVAIDYTSSSVPASVRQFKPLLFEEDDHFCCMLGPDMEQAVIGRGATEDEALSNWITALDLRLQNKNTDDEVAQYLRDTLAASKYDIN